MTQLQVLRIVVASPGDVKEERKILEKVAEELNKTIAKEHSLHIDVARWETDTYPGFHVDGPQAIIDKLLDIEDCDILIGIFWVRFGTPTKDARSGTEHEIQKAYEAWKRNNHPHIMLYFNEEPYSPKLEELDQWRQVLSFKKEISQEALYWEYKGIDHFTDLVRAHLSQFILHMSDLPQKNSRINTGTASITPTYKPPPMEEQISQWIKSKRRKRTRERYEMYMTNFRQVLLKSGLDLDSEDEIRILSLAEDWAYGTKGGEIAATTFNNRLSVLNSFYIFALKRKWVKSNPIKMAERRVERSINAAKVIDVERVKNALKSIDRSTPLGKRNYALLCLLLTTGRHLSEVIDLRCGAITREKNSMAITFNLNRTGEDLSVPLSPGVAKSLNEYISTAYPDGFTVGSPLWLSFSRYNKSKREAIGKQTISNVCSKYLGTSKVEATKRTFDAIRNKWGMKGIEKVLGIN